MPTTCMREGPCFPSFPGDAESVEELSAHRTSTSGAGGSLRLSRSPARAWAAALALRPSSMASSPSTAVRLFDWGLVVAAVTGVPAKRGSKEALRLRSEDEERPASAWAACQRAAPIDRATPKDEKDLAHESGSTVSGLRPATR
jgi:hypothetical protein